MHNRGLFFETFLIDRFWPHKFCVLSRRHRAGEVQIGNSSRTVAHKTASRIPWTVDPSNEPSRDGIAG